MLNAISSAPLVPHPSAPGLVAPDPSKVRLRHTSIPFCHPWVDDYFEEGLTIEAILRAGGFADPYRAGLRVFTDEAEIPRDRWATERPLRGMSLYAAIVPAGQDKDPLAVFLMDGVLAASLALANPAPGSLLAGEVGIGAITFGEAADAAVGVVAPLTVAQTVSPS